ncbi:uncharacterized protein LOC135076658 [Ostrinia nubilalis]|uniref:uncharacterized protein LOC135076658 n=1 Tax=Ostrinia nubilalis TaxID=29057 RepID=UPI00308225BA
MIVWRKNTSRRKHAAWSNMASDIASHIPRTTFVWIILAIANSRARAGELWPMERPDGMPVIQSLEVMCGKDHMDVHLTFSHPFEGIVSSKGQHGDPRCVYVPPSTGQTYFSFRIAYAKCGTKPDLHGQFYENTVVVQYDKDLLEVWDEAKRLRCEWFNDYEKTASKPPMVIADLDVVQLDFRGDNVDCWMEIQAGKGPWAPPVSGIVPLGSTLTLVVAINDYRGEFDMRVKSCAASDGSGHLIQLSDEYGCVLRPKMISRFLKAKAADERATVITYAFFHAFKFPDALSVHIRCKVEICRHGCLDHCQLAGVANQRHGALDRKDDRTHQDHNEINDSSAEDADFNFSEEPQRLPLEEAFGDEVSGDAVPAPAPLPQRAPAPVIEPESDHMSAVQELVEALFLLEGEVSIDVMPAPAPLPQRAPAPVIEPESDHMSAVQELVEALARPFTHFSVEVKGLLECEESGDAERVSAPVIELESDHMSVVQELVEALARPFTLEVWGLLEGELSGDAVPAPAPLPQRTPAPVIEPESDHMSAVQELVEALARPFTLSHYKGEVSGDAVPAPAPLPQRAPAPVTEPESDHMSAVQELVEALARPFTLEGQVSGDAIPVPALLTQRAPAPVIEPESDHMSAVQELVEALARPFTETRCQRTPAPVIEPESDHMSAVQELVEALARPFTHFSVEVKGLLHGEVSGDAIPAPTLLTQREPAPVIEPENDHMSAVQELVEALAMPFTDRPSDLTDRERFPHGPRNLGSDAKIVPTGDTVVPAKPPGPAVAGPRSLRKRRTVREGRSADVGVSGIYEVVSEADLAFGPSREPVTVFSGRIREEVVYGICMGAVSFGALFASAAGAAAGAALAAAVLLQRLRSRLACAPPAPPAPAAHSLAAWMALRLLGEPAPHPHHSRDG